MKYEENERRESERRFNKTLFEYIQKMVIPALKLQNTEFNYAERISNIPVVIDPKNIPKAYKICKCYKCFIQILKPFFDFQEIHSANKFIHFCYSNQQQKQHKDNDTQIKTLKLQEILFSIINNRLKSENKILKMIVFQDTFIENPLCFEIITFLMYIIRNEEEHPFRWLFELLVVVLA